MTWAYERIDWTAAAAGAAWAQAFLTVGAVAAAAWLQDRAMAIREDAARKRRLEGAASAAKWALSIFEGTLRRANHDGMDPQRFLAVYRKAEFEAAIRALRSVPVVEFGDPDLTATFLRLETAMVHASNELAAATGRVQSYMNAAVAGESIVKVHHTEIFNSAAGAERRVAQLVGRRPSL